MLKPIQSSLADALQLLHSWQQLHKRLQQTTSHAANRG